MFFTPKTVSSVVASFQRTIDDLQAIVARENANVERINIELSQLEAEKNNSLQESSAAIAVSEKISKLISA